MVGAGWGAQEWLTLRVAFSLRGFGLRKPKAVEGLHPLAPPSISGNEKAGTS
jgi:hypothetical protein